MSLDVAVDLESATLEIKRSPKNPIAALIKFGAKGDYTDSFFRLRLLQAELSDLIANTAEKSSLPFQGMYPQQNVSDLRTPLEQEIDELRITMSDPLRTALRYTFGALRKVDLGKGAKQVVESALENADGQIPLIPNFTKPDSGSELGTTVKVISEDTSHGMYPKEVWISMFPEAFTNIQSRPWLLLLDAFIACVEIKKAKGQNVNPEDMRVGIRDIVFQAINEGYDVDFKVKMELNSLIQQEEANSPKVV